MRRRLPLLLLSQTILMCTSCQQAAAKHPGSPITGARISTSIGAFRRKHNREWWLRKQKTRSPSKLRVVSVCLEGYQATRLLTVEAAMQCLLELLYAGQKLEWKTWEKRERNT